MNKSPKNFVVYHGNDNPFHKFSEYKPSFFTEDYNYSLGYGKHVQAYQLNCSNVFDTASDDLALRYYNEFFLKDELGRDAKKLNKGEYISFVDADNFWAFLSVETEINSELNYDSFYVSEGTDNTYKTDISIVPLNPQKITKPKIVDFEITPQRPVLNEEYADRLFELMGLHTHGYCHALSIVLAEQKIGTLKIVTQKDSPEIIHSFVLSDNGMSVDAGGVLSEYEMLQRYITCVTDMDISNFIIQEINSEELRTKTGINRGDLLRAKEFWDLSCEDYGKEISECLSLDIEKIKIKNETIDLILSSKIKKKNKRKI